MMGTKQTPGAFDCHAAAEPDEPLFTLLARDPVAPELVEEWARARAIAIGFGRAPTSDLDKVREAQACAKAMRDWRRANRSGGA